MPWALMRRILIDNKLINQEGNKVGAISASTFRSELGTPRNLDRSERAGGGENYMKLSNMAKLALMSCETIPEARRLLDMAEAEQKPQTILASIPTPPEPKPEPQHEPDKDMQTLFHRKDREFRKLEVEHRALKQKYDKLRGAPQPRKRCSANAPVDVGAASVTNEQVRQLIKKWREQSRAFRTSDIAVYFDIDKKKASEKVFGLWSKNSKCYWSWFRSKFFRVKQGKKGYVYYPKDVLHEQRQKKRGHRVVAMGSASGKAAKIKEISPSGE
jgi:hypothetical protein